MFLAAVIAVERLLRVDFNATASPVSLVRPALDGVKQKKAQWGRRGIRLLSKIILYINMLAYEANLTHGFTQFSFVTGINVTRIGCTILRIDFCESAPALILPSI